MDRLPIWFRGSYLLRRQFEGGSGRKIGGVPPTARGTESNAFAMTDAHEPVGGLEGFRLIPGYLDRGLQEKLLAAVREVMRRAPLYTPRMPKSGRPMSVRMTNCGPLGW